ncbi:hypothetical protein SAMN02982929_01250 [Saccharopolyspora kobensis]|uniref:Uncharacterized protein n=1 Tax=Saccharopolyspora kobensis TaxID=146035 RepID=A0A1H5WNW7_9PSEU|nr:hypothetical protein SAMN02982929_01250 [Saccharopolyspora kobensis]SFD77728.1 hypothetical protein SAMN05216506_106225 [Saccharopolyspora kobensis]
MCRARATATLTPFDHLSAQSAAVTAKERAAERFPDSGEPDQLAPDRAAVALLRWLALKRAFFWRFPHVFMSHHLRLRL